MKKGDAEALWEFATHLVEEREHNPELGILLDRRPSLKEEKEFVDRMVLGARRGDTINVMAVAEGVVAGNSAVTRGRSSDIRHVGHLGIAIDERFRGVGLGKLMMETLLDEASKAGMPLVTLDVFATNLRAIALYKSVGFTRYGVLPGGIVRGGKKIDEVKMSRLDPGLQ